ncbi:MAG TPA: hypothetical protein RMH99_06800 [Sandaracinaceae bacterium LLY-WYZ-13_1]|nr:hypothetical protein [Sandaracinaceae bacterium LLY-WYZ-13_1]
MNRTLLFLNSHRAKSGTVDGRALHPDYVLLAKFFGCGPIDRTQTLDIGVDYGVVQPIPEERTEASFGEVCDAVATDLADEARALDLPIQVAWSGGIDSTVALLALTKVLGARGELSRLTVLVSTISMREYPWFYEHVIVDRLQTRPLGRALPDALSEEAITVTGEHGDQLFGSDHLAGLVKGGIAHLPWEHVVPSYVAEKLKGADRVDRVLRYLEPQVARAPAPITTAFDYIWWCNFSLKWQQVSLRVPVFRRGRIGPLHERTRHFFGDARFQAWSLSNPQVRDVRDWRAYKLEAKKRILEATGDFEYFTTKEKEPSLKHVLIDRRAQGDERYRVHMYDDYEVHVETFQKRTAAR